MNNYAYIENGIVTNVIVWDGVPFTPAVKGQPYIEAVDAVPAQPAVPEVPAVLDENGNVITPAIPAKPAVDAIPAVEGQPFIADVAAFGWSPPDGVTLVQIDPASGVGVGFSYDGSTFSPPAAPPPPVLSPSEILAANTATQSQLLAAASVAIAPLQLAVSLGEATDEETALAKAWVAYTRAVKAVDLTKLSPVWPAAPAA